MRATVRDVRILMTLTGVTAGKHDTEAGALLRYGII
jgi:hypothetical protein